MQGLKTSIFLKSIICRIISAIVQASFNIVSHATHVTFITHSLRALITHTAHVAHVAHVAHATHWRSHISHVAHISHWRAHRVILRKARTKMRVVWIIIRIRIVIILGFVLSKIGRGTKIIVLIRK